MNFVISDLNSRSTCNVTYFYTILSDHEGACWEYKIFSKQLNKYFTKVHEKRISFIDLLISNASST